MPSNSYKVNPDTDYAHYTSRPNGGEALSIGADHEDYDLFQALCHAGANGYRHQFSWPVGWHTTVTKALSRILKVTDQAKITQIKEKFAGLRIYYECLAEDQEAIQKIIMDAEKEASRTCARCGWRDHQFEENSFKAIKLAKANRSVQVWSIKQPWGWMYNHCTSCIFEIGKLNA